MHMESSAFAAFGSRAYNRALAVGSQQRSVVYRRLYERFQVLPYPFVDSITSIILVRSDRPSGLYSPR